MHGYGATSFSDELRRADALGTQLSDELHRRRDDERIARVLADLLKRLPHHDWAAHFPVSDELLIASVEEEASKPARRPQLEWSIRAERLAALEQQETLIAAGSLASAPAIKRARAKRKLLAEIGTHAPAGRVPSRSSGRRSLVSSRARSRAVNRLPTATCS